VAIWIDWHSHHMPPEVAEKFAVWTGKKPAAAAPLKKGFAAIEQQPDPEHIKRFTEKNSRELLHL
jgi:hypothetical protein